MRYLNGKTSYGLVFRLEKIELNSFLYSDYAGDVVDHKSMPDFIVKLGNAVCLWGSKKQTTVALSTCEAKYFAMTFATKEVIWVCRILKEAGCSVKYPVSMRSDNLSAINWVKSEACPPSRAKRIDVQLHFIRDLIRDSSLQVEHTETDENEAEVLKKSLEKGKLCTMLQLVGIGNPGEECMVLMIYRDYLRLK